jgi:transcriptional regulator with XRE-family HTH domain
MDKTVGDRIRKMRVLKDLSQENVAEAIGMSTGNYGKIERGEISISITHLHQSSIALDVPITSLFEEVPVVNDLHSPYGFVTYKEF